MSDACALCGIEFTPADAFTTMTVQAGATAILLHHGQYTEFLGWECDPTRPILTTCYSAWTAHGHRPYGYQQ